MDVMPPYRKVCQGTAESELQGTGLLYIAGEKTACSGILGHSTVLNGQSTVLFLQKQIRKNAGEPKFLLIFFDKCDIVFRNMGH